MRTALLLVGLLPGVSLLAAPVPVSGTPLSAEAKKRLHAEALVYAQQLLSVSTQVSTGYIKAVSRAELLIAALNGLHEAVRQPGPSGLRADLKRIVSDEGLIEYLIETRMRLGIHESLKEHRALLVSCRAMLRSLDASSDVVTEEDRRNQPWGDQPACLGLELADNVGVGPQRVLKVFPGTPAQRAGIRPGDLVTHLDDKELKGMTTAQAAGLLKGKENALTRVAFNADLIDAGLPDTTPDPVSLRLERPDRKPWMVKLPFQTTKPESIFGVSRNDDNSWNYLVDREKKIAHIRIEMLNRGTALELSQALARLDDDGLQGLILDLRWSQGGFLDEAIGIAGLFLGDCVVATVRSRGHEEVKYHNTQPKRYEKLPLVVLVNGKTVGGSELIAAALQDMKRGHIAGQRTFGKGTVQTALYVDIPGANLKLTSGEFVRPSGKNLHRGPESTSKEDWGIRPESGLEFPMSPQLMKELHEQWQRQTLRPGKDLKILPLDDPATDPQRQHALAWLRKQIPAK